MLEILEDVNVRTRPTAALVGWGGVADGADAAALRTQDGHNVVGTVYTEANSFYWNTHKGDPYAPCGEVEYCQGIAAACDSGIYGSSRKQPGPRVCWGIQGTVNDMSDPAVPDVLAYMCRTRNFRGIRGASRHKTTRGRGSCVVTLALGRPPHPDTGVR